MELLQLRYFQTVARTQHMTQAARELRVAQPALSMTISRLEKELNAPLFERKGRQIRLNSFGKAFLKKVERALTALDEGEREIADMTGLEHGQVSLAMTTLKRFAGLFGHFLSAHPHVSFQITQASAKEISEKLLESGEVDFCLSSPPIERPDVRGVPLMTEEILLAVPQGHPFAKRKKIDLQEVAHDSFISLKRGYSFREITDQFCREAGFTPNIVCEGDEPAAISDLVRAGLGVAFLPEPAKEEKPSLHLIKIEKPVCQWTLQLAWLEERYLSQAARIFRDAMVYHFGPLDSQPGDCS